MHIYGAFGPSASKTMCFTSNKPEVLAGLVSAPPKPPRGFAPKGTLKLNPGQAPFSGNWTGAAPDEPGKEHCLTQAPRLVGSCFFWLLLFLRVVTAAAAAGGGVTGGASRRPSGGSSGRG